MRRLTFVAIGLVVLATAGLAVAKAVGPTKSITSVTGTFTAMTVEQIGKPTSCTASDGKTLVTAKARYSGVAAGDGKPCRADHARRANRRQRDRQHRRG